MSMAASAEGQFWALAEPLLAQPAVTRSTMMGLPCLRVSGRFFAAFDRRSGALVVKMPEGRVNELIDTAQAQAFAPAGRRFREWAASPSTRSDAWSLLLGEALAFVSTANARED